MEQRKLSAVRKALFWWFRSPANPYICASFAVDTTGAQEYLARLSTDHGRSVTIHHLVTAVVSRVLEEYPRANDRLGHGKLFRRRRTGLGMPVDLRADGRQGSQETAMAVIEDTDRLSLVQIAEGSRQAVRAERAHRSKLPWMRWLSRLGDAAPYPLLAPLLTSVDLVSRIPAVNDLLFGNLPGSGVTNVGASIEWQQGVLFRGGSMDIPQRLMHIGTVWGLSVIQDEVIPIDGEPAVRPMLPVVLCFDHRLFDGVYAGRLILRFCEILQNPAPVFGADGTARPAG
ncbi:MAG: 2-oxo acid dehydrogenase subunit E2 [Deltaproteobacteria bacterium]|jgi:pyruvate/2-oxoglutarate dehydrogenase complex dihydrolipoamide acyltransferase (E2) component|nr:2-oxo acid dehydrogenase subunit E2 [Deltaproteobacteria bacterium]